MSWAITMSQWQVFVQSCRILDLVTCFGHYRNVRIKSVLRLVFKFSRFFIIIKGGEGEMCPFKGTEGKKHLRSSGKKPQKWETGGAEPPGPEYRLSPLLGRHARPRLKFNWCVLFIIRQGVAKSQLRRKSLVPIWKFDKKFLQDLVWKNLIKFLNWAIFV